LVVDPDHTRRGPGGTLGFLAFGPRANRAAQDDVAAICFHRDPDRVDLRDSSKGLLDLAPDFGG
jgi:hypothetical protein